MSFPSVPLSMELLKANMHNFTVVPKKQSEIAAFDGLVNTVPERMVDFHRDFGCTGNRQTLLAWLRCASGKSRPRLLFGYVPVSVSRE